MRINDILTEAPNFATQPIPGSSSGLIMPAGARTANKPSSAAGETTPPSGETEGSIDTKNSELSNQFYQLLNQIRYLDYDNSLALLNLLTK